MQELLIYKLYAYTKENNPDLLWALQKENAVTEWLLQKVEGIDSLLLELIARNTPVYEIEEHCMAVLTAELKPSRYQFVRQVLEEEFPKAFETLSVSGQLIASVTSWLPVIESAFEHFGFDEDNEHDRLLRYAVTGLLHDCLGR